MKLNIKSINSPLQMIGFFLAWVETVLAVSLWPVQGNDRLLTFLLFSLVGIAVIIAGSLGFALIHLVRNYPQWLYNPGDYDPDVQDELFEHDYSRSEAEKLNKRKIEAGRDVKQISHLNKTSSAGSQKESVVERGGF